MEDLEARACFHANRKLYAVRGDPQFQNPILRLGCDSSTYARILQKSALSRITTHYQAAMPHAPKRKEETPVHPQMLRHA